MKLSILTYNSLFYFCVCSAVGKSERERQQEKEREGGRERGGGERKGRGGGGERDSERQASSTFIPISSTPSTIILIHTQNILSIHETGYFKIIHV